LFSVFTGQIMINHSQFCFRGILWFSHKIAPYSVGCPTFGVQSSSATGQGHRARRQYLARPVVNLFTLLAGMAAPKRARYFLSTVIMVTNG
ncbi:hypothetical protein ACGWAW_002895, partial [Klebsiella pneumoniae]